MSESAVFELKLQIQHLEEKLTFLAGGTNGAELVAVLMEKDAELEQNSKKLKEVEASRFLLAEGAKRVDAKRRELMRQSEHQLVRVEALEKELDRQLGISDEQRRKVADTKEELVNAQEELRKTQAEMASKEASAQESLATARDDASSLQRIVEAQRETIAGLEANKKALEETVSRKDDEIKSMEQRKKGVATRSREMKNHLEKLLQDSQNDQADLKGQRSSLEAELTKLRRRADEKTKMMLEEERKTTALARECGNLKTELESARQDITSAAEELAAVRLTKKEADEALLGKDKENNKLRAKNESLRVEMDRRLHLLNQEKGDLSDRMEESIRELKERENFLHSQLEATGKENTEIQEALTLQISEMEERLKVANEDKEHLKAEGRKMKASSKSEARWRARAEDVIAGRTSDLERANAEVASTKHLRVELRHLQAENKDLKARIERQEAFHKRRIEKEKKEKRIRSGPPTGSGRAQPVGGDIASGRGVAQLLPLPPPMGCGDNDARGGGGSSQRLSTTPTSAGRRGDDDGDEGGGAGNGGSDPRELFVSERPRSSSAAASSPCFFATPDSSIRNVVDKENRSEAQPRRAPAWDGVRSGGTGGCGWEDESAAGAGSKAGGCRASGGDRLTTGSVDVAVRRVSLSSKNNVGRATVASAAAQRPLESSKIRRVARSPATRAVHEGGDRSTGAPRAASRGRSAVAAKVSAPRSSSLGIQSRAASGWR
eukprot:g6453.t1